MGFVEALLLSLALCVDTLVVSTTTAFRSRPSWRQGLLMAAVFGLCQFAFPLAGALIGDVAHSFIQAVDHWIAFALLAFIGGKMIWDQVGSRKDEGSTSDLRHPTSDLQPPASDLRLSTCFLLGIATSIDAFAVGIGLGLGHAMATVLWVVALVGVVTFLAALLGIALGRRNIPIPERTANIIAGAVLIGLGVKILVEHLFL
ncbi:MAG: manganese efflux pump MntP family protein [Bacteroidales bacterium]|nr:manganese efflux pump MntP family protein [Bacteroidales bacterium]